MKEKLMSFRLPVSIDKEIEKLAIFEDTDKSKVMRELLILGVKEKKLEQVLKLYSQGKISLWKAARITDISLWKIMEIVKEKKIQIQYGERELREDLKP